MFVSTKNFIVALCLVAYSSIGAHASNLYSYTANELHAEFSSKLNPLRMNNSVKILIDYNNNIHKVSYKVIDSASKKIITHKSGHDIISKRFIEATFENDLGNSVFWKSDFSLITDLLQLSYIINLANDKESDLCGYFFEYEGVVDIKAARADFMNCLKSATQKKTPLLLGNDQYCDLRSNFIELLKTCGLISCKSLKNEWFLSANTREYYELIMNLERSSLKQTSSEPSLKSAQESSLKYLGMCKKLKGLPEKYFDKLSQMGKLFVTNMKTRFENIMLRRNNQKDRFIYRLIIDSLQNKMNEMHHVSPQGVIRISCFKALADIVTHFSMHLVEYGLHHGIAQTLTKYAAAISFATAGTFNMPVLATLAIVEGTFTLYELKESIENGIKVEAIEKIFSINLNSNTSTLNNLIQDYTRPCTYKLTAFDQEIVKAIAIRALMLGNKYEEIIEATLHQQFIINLLKELRKNFN